MWETSGTAGYRSFGPIEKHDVVLPQRAREGLARGKPGLQAHAQHTEPKGENLGTWFSSGATSCACLTWFVVGRTIQPSEANKSS